MSYSIENILLFLSNNSFPIQIIASIFLLMIISLCSEQKTSCSNFELLELDEIESTIAKQDKGIQQIKAWEKYLIENGFN